VTDMTGDLISVLTTSEPRSTGQEKRLTGPGRHWGYSKPNCVLVFGLLNYWFTARGAACPSVCLAGGYLGVCVETFMVKGFVEPAGSRLCFKFYVLFVQVQSNIQL